MNQTLIKYILGTVLAALIIIAAAMTLAHVLNAAYGPVSPWEIGSSFYIRVILLLFLM